MRLTSVYFLKDLPGARHWRDEEQDKEPADTVETQEEWELPVAA